MLDEKDRRLLITTVHDRLKENGDFAIGNFTSKTRNMLNQENQDLIADVIARRLEDIVDPISATAIAADLAQTIQDSLQDAINDATDNASRIVDNFVKSVPSTVSNIITNHPQEKAIA